LRHRFTVPARVVSAKHAPWPVVMPIFVRTYVYESVFLFPHVSAVKICLFDIVPCFVTICVIKFL